MKKFIAFIISPGMVVLLILSGVLGVIGGVLGAIGNAITDYFRDVLDEET